MTRRSSEAASEWLRRVEAEYRSAALTQHLTLWLTQLGASPATIREGMRVARDELAHAEASRRVARAAGAGRTDAPVIPQETLALQRDEARPLLDAAVLATLDVFCVGETVAVPLFRELRAECTEPVARRALDRILRDEARHRAFGWRVLDELLARDPERLGALAAREVGSFARATLDAYGGGSGERGALEPADRAWGLMPAARYAEVVARSLERDVEPRLRSLALGPSAATVVDRRHV